MSKDETEALEADPVFEVPQEMQQMLQTFSRELNKELFCCSQRVFCDLVLLV